MFVGVGRTARYAAVVLIEVRGERAEDIAAIRDVNRRAFGSAVEARIVDALRSSGALSLSLVAVLDELVVGHIAYSPAIVAGVTGAALGPMAVLPEHQRQGIGTRLVQAGNRQLEERGCPFIVLVGYPHFYPRFGFAPARARGIESEWEVPDDSFLLMVLDEATMRGVRGPARYRLEFLTA